MVRVDLKLRDQRVERVSFDYAITLLTDIGAELRIGSAFLLRDADSAEVSLNPGDFSAAGELLSRVLHQRIVTATAEDAGGALRIEFGNGTRIDVSPSPTFEAWTFVTATGMRSVSLPGGGLAIWESPDA